MVTEATLQNTVLLHYLDVFVNVGHGDHRVPAFSYLKAVLDAVSHSSLLPSVFNCPLDQSDHNFI